MAIRPGTGAVRDIVEILALLPWWAGVLLALLSYFLIHPYAIQLAPTSIAAGEVATSALVSALANVGQYLVPFL